MNVLTVQLPVVDFMCVCVCVLVVCVLAWVCGGWEGSVLLVAYNIQCVSLS